MYDNDRVPAAAGPILFHLLFSRVPTEARHWFAGALAGSPLEARMDRKRFKSAFAAATRRVGQELLDLTRDEVERLRSVGVSWVLSSWCVDDLARVLLLLRAAAHLPAGEEVRLVAECYREGSVRERQAVVRALPFLREPEDYLAIAIAACRSTSVQVFEAIACDNPFPGRWFDRHHLSEMVVRAQALDVDVRRVLVLGAPAVGEVALA